MSVFFGGEFFDGGFFQELTQEQFAGGKGDNKRRRFIFKPTGLPPYREVRKKLDERVKESREIHREVAREILGLPKLPKLPETLLERMSLVEIENEIGERLRKQLRAQLEKDDEEIILLLLAAAAG